MTDKIEKKNNICSIERDESDSHTRVYMESNDKSSEWTANKVLEIYNKVKKNGKTNDLEVI